MSLNYWGFTRTPFTKELPIEDFFPGTQFQELAARALTRQSKRGFVPCHFRSQFGDLLF